VLYVARLWVLRHDVGRLVFKFGAYYTHTVLSVSRIK